MLVEKKPIREGTWSGKDIETLNKHSFLSSKPVVYLVNIGKEEYIKKKNKFLPAISEYIKKNAPGPMLPYSAEFESEVLEAAGSADKEARDKAAEELGAPTMIHKIVNCGYRTL